MDRMGYVTPANMGNARNCKRGPVHAYVHVLYREFVNAPTCRATAFAENKQSYDEDMEKFLNMLAC